MNNTALFEFIRDICSYATIYKKIFNTTCASTLFSYNNHLQRLFHVLDVCDVSTFLAYILKLLKDYNVQDTDSLPDAFIQEIGGIESLVIRHVVCGASLKNFNKNCLDLVSGKRTLAEMLEEKDSELSDTSVRFGLRKITANKTAFLILFWIELKRRSMDNRIDGELKYSYSLEHVMPQSWDMYWPIINPQVVNAISGEAIPDEFEAAEARRAAIFELGNMTLLRSNLNSSLRNYEFTRKIKGDDKKYGIEYYASNITVAKDIVASYNSAPVWNELSIRQRTEMLADEFLKIW